MTTIKELTDKRDTIYQQIMEILDNINGLQDHKKVLETEYYSLQDQINNKICNINKELEKK